MQGHHMWLADGPVMGLTDAVINISSFSNYVLECCKIQKNCGFLDCVPFVNRLKYEIINSKKKIT